ncbi:flavodoxin [Fenollaria sporofastidiosus]|uniref:flavodoxin n=1 Tax=Fenollaria sporofastidiosus TaxID=2811778 RepID=UPI001BFFE161|nr:flavodoxin [Fenollaria sporofastidiosus]
MKASVIFWSGTGNTEAMANEIAAKLKELGADTKLLTVEEASVDDAKDADLLALGCPAMGAEELEEDYFRPYFDSIKDVIKDKKVAIFGSYEWNSGEWMDLWKNECADSGIAVVDALIAYDHPDADALAKCRELAEKLMK